MTSGVGWLRLRHQAFAKFDGGYSRGAAMRSDPGALNVRQHNTLQ
jgi:hypothetical protein